MKPTYTHHDPAGLPFSLPITTADALALGITPEEITAGEKRFDLDTVGPWQILRTIRGIAKTTEHDADGRAVRVTLHGMRSMHAPRPLGYGQEGRVSIGGRKLRAFTSSQMFEITDGPKPGHLVDVATLYACTP